MEWYVLLLKKYGYLAILTGTLIEGEIFLALGGVFARKGILNLWLVVVLAVTGSFISHFLFYVLGRWRGPALVCRFRRLQESYPRAHALAQRFGPACIFVVQYLYGLRLITSLTLGTLGITARVFIFWQLVSISCWAVALALAGYLFGTAIEYFITRVEILLTLVLLAALLVLWAYYRLWHWVGRKSGPNRHLGLATPQNPTAKHHGEMAREGKSLSSSKALATRKINAK